jgi:hypothetical protein
MVDWLDEGMTAWLLGEQALEGNGMDGREDSPSTASRAR